MEWAEYMFKQGYRTGVEDGVQQGHSDYEQLTPTGYR